ncbi:MAG TPA: acyl-CoA dehydrogenase family protein, partial [Solirubrobacterales bacterium]|nr:acyl-CoA dehydrogenase family protein [Solirubrobacterales bacterium]
MPAERNLPTPEAEEIVGLARAVAREELAPRVAAAEEEAAFPRDVFR